MSADAFPAPRLSRPEAVSFTVSYADWGANGVRVVVNDDGTGAGRVAECDTENNDDVWTDSPC